MSLDASTLDPAQLAAFRQQAGPIVAQERGLTPSCLVKLAGVARGLGIAEAQIDAAVHSLSPAEPEAPPNPQAERFRERLRKDLAGKTKTIIGPTIEQQILAKAATKYGLDESLARQVVGEVAAELGLTRITASEAIESLAAQIDVVVGQSTWLAREAWDRLRTAGDKWGIDLAIVEELIEERLAANRADIARRRLRLNLAIAGVVGLAVVAALGTAIVMNRAGPNTSAAVSPGVVPSPGINSAEPSQPAWWDVELALENGRAKASLGGLGGACDLIASSAAAQRAAGYERMIAVAAAPPLRQDLQNAAASIAAAALALEPDEAAAARLQAALVALLPAASGSLETQPTLAASYWAAETAAAALARPAMSQARKQTLAAAIAAALRGHVELQSSPTELAGSLRGLVTLAAYHALTSAATKEPAAAAARYAELSASAAESLSKEEWLRADTTLLAAALPSAGQRWRAYEGALSRCLSATDPLPAIKLLETYRRIGDPELSRKLAELLALRAGVKPKSWQPADVVAAVRKGLGGVNASVVTGADRWLALREQAALALEKSNVATNDPRTLLAHTVELAHLTTLAMALAQGDAGFAVFDAGISQPPDLEPKEPIDAASPASPPAKRTLRNLTSAEQRELARLLDMLANRAPGRQVPRESALRAIAEMPANIPDIPPRAAELLAAYLLAEKSPEEMANVLPKLTELRRWLHLRLAVADGLPQSKLSADDQRALATALAAEALPPEANSPAALAQALVADAKRELDSAAALRAAAAAAARTDYADRAATQLQQTWLTRARLLGAAPVAVNAAQSPAAALELSLAPLAAGDEADLPPLQQALRYLANDDLRLTVAWQRLLLELSAHRAIRSRPEQAGAARQLQTESLAAATAATSALAQLRQQERTLLTIWMLYAPEL